MAVRQVRAPQEDGAIVAEPPLADAQRLVHANRNLLAASRLSQFLAPARVSLLQAAQTYLGEDVSIRNAAIVMAGHQPELFHPGVWVKNFALSGLTETTGSLPVNLIVDNDTVRSTALHYPDTSSPQPHRGTEPFDAPASGEPYEECAVRDEALFASLPQRLRPGWPFQPLLAEFWSEALKAGRRTRFLGERFASARRAIERRWGCHNLEVPVSAVCQTQVFARFACDLLTNLPRFHVTYNDAVHDYRQRYGLRSTSHPVPDLAKEGDWLETPFWAWRSGQARRGRLMARLTPETLDLRVGDEPWPSLPHEPNAMWWAFHTLGQRGFKVRSRALTNTMYARLFLCDLFIHGIGGGKYDEVTDAIIRRYYSVEPPAYLVLSATLLLPLPTYPATSDDCRRRQREVRGLYYNPERHLDDNALSQPEIAELKARKETLIREIPPTRRGRRERFRQVREMTEQLHGSVEARIAAARRELAECDAQVRANAVLRRRDYAFCLYPESTLRPFCEQFLHIGSR